MIGKNDIENLSKLARIELDEEEKKSLAEDIEKILSFVEQIKEAGGEIQTEPADGKLRNIMREDKNPHKKGIHTEELLETAPEREGAYIKVQKIL